MKTPDYFYKVVAEEKGIPLELVKKVNTYFWRYGIKQHLSKANHTGIYIKNLGTILVSRYKLREEIAETIWKIRKIKQSKWYTPIKKQEVLNSYLNRLRPLLVKRNELAIEHYKKLIIWNEQMDRIPEADTSGSEESLAGIGGCDK